MKLSTYILIFWTIFLSCCKKELTRYSYYDTGEIKEIFYHPDKNKMDEFEASLFDTSGVLLASVNYDNGKKNGIAKEYFRDGIVKSQRNFCNDKLHGLLQNFNSKGEILSEFLYLFDKKVAQRQYYISPDSVYEKFVSYQIKNDTNFYEEGQLVFNLKLSRYDTLKSFFYQLIHEKANSDIITFEFINRYQWDLNLYQTVDLNEFINPRKLMKVTPFESTKNKLSVSLDSIELIDNLLIGILEIQNNNIADSIITKRFTVYDLIE